MQLSSFNTGLISLVLTDSEAGSGPGVPANASAVVDAIQTRHTDSFRITARTAYIATSPSTPAPASSASQAAVILSALAAGVSTSHCDLQNWWLRPCRCRYLAMACLTSECRFVNACNHCLGWNRSRAEAVQGICAGVQGTEHL